MIINLNELSYKDKIDISGTYSFDENYLKDSQIKKLDNVKAEGYIYQNSADEYIINLSIEGKMTILDSITLEEVEYPFNINIDDNLDIFLQKDENSLDIMELLWQNIVLEVPIRYTKSDADNLKGDNWEVLNAEEKQEEIDPRMQKLLDYYKGGE